MFRACLRRMTADLPGVAPARGATVGSDAGARPVVGDRRAAHPAAARASAGRRHPLRRRPGGVHRDRLRADRRLCLAAPARGVRRVQGDRAPAVRGLDPGRAVAPAAPGGPGPARRTGDDRLVPRGRGRGQPAGQKRGELTGPNPVGRGKPGSKLHVLTDATGLPLAVAVSAANTHDSQALMPLVQAVPAVRSRRGPRRRRPAKLHADKGYDYEHLRAWLRARGITSRIARRGVETSTRLGRHRWIIERSFAWLTGYRQLTLRYERSARLFCAFLTLAATLTCYKNLLQEAHHMRHALRTWRWGPVVHKRRPWHAGRGGGSVRGRSVPHRSPRRRMACMTPGDLGRVP